MEKIYSSSTFIFLAVLAPPFLLFGVIPFRFEDLILFLFYTYLILKKSISNRPLSEINLQNKLRFFIRLYLRLISVNMRISQNIGRSGVLAVERI